MNTLMSKMKWFVIATLVVLVAGLVLFGVMGYNNSIDQKNGYEVVVSVDQGIAKAKEILKDTTEKYFSDNKITSEGYAFQEIDDGSKLVYKFNEDPSKYFDGLEDAINTALLADTATNAVKSSVEIKETLSKADQQMGYTLLAVGVAIVVAFAYSLIVNKLAGGVAVLCSSVLSYLLFVSLMSIVRLPALNTASVASALSVALSMFISSYLAHAYANAVKASSASKVNPIDVVNGVAKAELLKLILTIIAIAIVVVPVMLVFVPSFMVVGGQVAIAGISAIYSSCVCTPLIWSAIKQKQSK